MAESKNKINAEIKNQKNKVPFYFYLILISIPIIFFILLEVGLRIFNYGEDLSMWVQATPGKKIINANVAKRYFSNVKNFPTTIEDIFDSTKSDNSFRVFVLGESSAAGYPFMPLGSFSRYLRKRLEITYPQKNIEVINLGMTAINSYTIRDFMPEVLKQKPDVILIYTGHNEYYGALGVGSLESLGNSRWLINLYLKLIHFKTVELIKDFLQWSGRFVFGEEKQKTGTLMSRMAKEQSIDFNSETFLAGIEQFDGNMRDIIEMCKDENVPLIFGTLASNLKDQKPFVTKNENEIFSASKVYKQAELENQKSNFKKADSLYRIAKDYDLLRFRAPEKINRLIKQYKKEYGVEVVDIDSIFSSLSPNGIIGNNLMTDHLHPTLEGFQIIGKAFYDKMDYLKLLPKDKPAIESSLQDERTKKEFIFPELDSVMAVQRIALLKNDWPYVKPEEKKLESEIIPLRNLVDSLSYEFLKNRITWLDAHFKLAENYLLKKDFDNFIINMSALIYQYPVIVEYYNYMDNVGLVLLKQKDYVNAKKIFWARYKLRPDAITTKWLGNIALANNEIQTSIKFLEESMKYNPEDLQVLYNLSGAYALNKEFEKAKLTLKKLLQREPNYPGANELAQQLFISN
ncbi:MAG: GDSL-type esterase/lipase family protein [Melioribacteraceae bacterium]|nr:GDSL-type esterase/lipase family protein [Melioribacteraceae bacterium]